MTKLAAVFALVALTSAPAFAQGDTRFAMRGDRVSDAIIARDLARFDSLERVAGNTRSAAFVGLARDAYERNDEGVVTGRMLDQAQRRSAISAIRTKRNDLWSLLDSVYTRPTLSASAYTQAVALEVALVRAGSPLLGAPSCEVWEKEAMKLADALRVVPPVPAPPPAVSVVQPASVPAPLSVTAPAELRAVPSLVHFALDKSLLAAPTQRVLDAVVDSLARYSGVRVVLEGHTDVRGSVSYNEALSNRRVTAVREYLLSKGMSAGRISTKAMGKSKLDTDKTGVTDHALNRRVVLRYFTADGKEIPTVGQLYDLQVEGKK